MRSLWTHTKNSGLAAGQGLGIATFTVMTQVLGRRIGGSPIEWRDRLFNLIVLPIAAGIIGFTYSLLRDVPLSRGRSGIGARVAAGALAGAIGGLLIAGLRLASGTTHVPFLIRTVIAGVALGSFVGLGAYFRARSVGPRGRASRGFVEGGV